MEEKNKYVLIYEFNNNTFKHMIRHVDSDNLKGLYIPKDCTRLTLYTREDCLISRNKQEQWEQVLGFVRQKLDEMIESNPESQRSKVRARSRRFYSKRKTKTLVRKKIKPLKDIFFGEKYTRSEVVNIFGVDSYPYQLILTRGSDGLICYLDEDDLYHVIDVFYKDSEFTMGKISYGGYYEGDEEELEY